jgi:hypothetical protein
MCLIKNKLKYTGNKRITCYKVLESTLMSPYQWFQYVLNHRYDTSFGFGTSLSSTIGGKIDWHMFNLIIKTSFSPNSFINNIKASVNYYCKKDYDVITEGFHTFKDIFSAENLRKELKYYSDGREYIIVKCTIPEYTWYYEGASGFSYSREQNSYASESIILEEILS